MSFTRHLQRATYYTLAIGNWRWGTAGDVLVLRYRDELAKRTDVELVEGQPVDATMLQQRADLNSPVRQRWRKDTKGPAAISSS